MFKYFSISVLFGIHSLILLFEQHLTRKGQGLHLLLITKLSLTALVDGFITLRLLLLTIQ